MTGDTCYRGNVDVIGGTPLPYNEPIIPLHIHHTRENQQASHHLETLILTNCLMRFHLAFKSRILPRTAVTAVQGRRPMNGIPTRTFATVGSHPATDQMGTPRPKTKWGMERETLYIGGGLAAIGGLWYYYATVSMPVSRRSESAWTPMLPRTSKGAESDQLKTRRAVRGRRSKMYS
ncbi:hypothetical protein BJV74DRAFT_871412, partial [Russula compacta]